MATTHLLDTEGAVVCTATSEHVTSDRGLVSCPDCLRPPTPESVVAACGCPLESICTVHRNLDHRHCTTCGVPVFWGSMTQEWDEHHCPPGFLLNPPEKKA